MSPLRVLLLVIGALMALVGLVAMALGTTAAVAYGTNRDDDGYLSTTVDELATETVALTAEEIDLEVDPGAARRFLRETDTDVRLRVTAVDSDRSVFVGIAPETDLDAYLTGVAHDEIRRIGNDDVIYRSRSGGSTVDRPGDQSFWVVSTEGVGTQELIWEPSSGRWAVAVMNADGSPGVIVDADVGARSDAVFGLSALVIGIGAVLAVLGAVLIVIGGAGLAATTAPTPAGAEPVATAVGTAAIDAAPSPVTLEAQLDPRLSRWQWLVKWFLAIPHMIVLAFLYLAFVVVTAVAFFAILFTGRYPRSLFDFNLGVLRWGWRVQYYAFGGGLGTDRYPPFSLGVEPEYPATLAIEYPGELSRWKVLVKWWLLAIPHYMILGVLAWGTSSYTNEAGQTVGSGANLLSVLVIIAAVILLFTGRYPRRLFDLIIGINRWVYRVIAYVALMTDVYPPFRLDQGGAETPAGRTPPPPGGPEDEAVDLRPPAREPAVT